jgi:hypothetical protein
VTIGDIIYIESQSIADIANQTAPTGWIHEQWPHAPIMRPKAVAAHKKYANQLNPPYD